MFVQQGSTLKLKTKTKYDLAGNYQLATRSILEWRRGLTNQRARSDRVRVSGYALEKTVSLIFKLKIENLSRIIGEMSSIRDGESN